MGRPSQSGDAMSRRIASCLITVLLFSVTGAKWPVWGALAPLSCMWHSAQYVWAGRKSGHINGLKEVFLSPIVGFLICRMPWAAMSIFELFCSSYSWVADLYDSLGRDPYLWFISRGAAGQK